MPAKWKREWDTLDIEGALEATLNGFAEHFYGAEDFEKVPAAARRKILKQIARTTNDYAKAESGAVAT